MTTFDRETVETSVGEYQIRWYADEFPEQPYDEGFTLAVDGRDYYAAYSRIRIDEGNVPDEVWNVIFESFDQRDVFSMRSGAALVRYLTLKGYKGVTLVDEDYRPVEASTDRFERIHGVAWAPEDVTYPIRYVAGQLAEWRAWAEGDVFGWEVIGPDEEFIEGVGGYYGFHSDHEYTREEAMAVIENDVRERTEASNRAGAGFIGIL